MNRADVIYLISETPKAHGVFEKSTETERMVYCEVKSVTYREFYAAEAAGITPSYIFVLSDYSEYQGEKKLRWNGALYRVTRTYEKSQTIEITAEEITNDNI